MAKKKANFGGKLLIAAACAATIAQFPISQVNAYSEGVVPTYAKTLGISGTDYITASTIDSEGYYAVGGVGEVEGAVDSAVIAKYSPSGNMLWGNVLGGTHTTQSEGNETIVYDIEHLSNGNYIVVADIDGTHKIFEIDGETGNVASSTDATHRLTSIAIDESTAVPQFAGVNGEDDSIYIYTFNPQSEAWAILAATNIQDGIAIDSIRSDGNNGYIALARNGNDNLLYYGSGAGAYPTIKTISSDRITTIRDIAPYGNDYISVGEYLGLMYISKIDKNGVESDWDQVNGVNESGKTSSFYSVATLDNGEIIAVGTANYSSSPKTGPKGGSDAIIARYNSDLDPSIVINPSGDGDETLATVATNGNKFYVGGSSTSSDISIDHYGNEMYSIIAGYGQGVTADVTFHIDGDIPEGVDAPEDGEYHFTEDGNDLPTPGSTDNQLFSGWYTDEGLENELGDQVPSDDLDLYGKYFDVETENLNDLDTFDHWCEYQNDGTLLVCTNPEDNTITAGETSDPFTPQVPSVVMDDAATGKWVSDDPTIATVDQNGKVTGVSEGTTNIRFIVYDKNGNIIYEYVLSFTVKAAANPDTVDVTPMILTIAAFSAVSFAAIFRRAFNKR